MTCRSTLLALSLLLVGLAPTVRSAEAPVEAPASAQAAHDVGQPDGLRGRLLRDEPSPVRRLDPAIFTDILPVTASDPGLRLPDDQVETPWQEGAPPE